MNDEQREKRVNEFFELRKKNLFDEEKRKAIGQFIDDMVPSMKKLRDLEGNYRKTPAYAWDRIQQAAKHVEENPQWENENKHCSTPGCKELVDRKELQKHLDVLMQDIVKQQG